METANKKTGLIIVVAAYAAFLATFNETLLNVAFSSIMVDFSIPVSTVQWLATAYMLGVAVFIPVAAFAYKSIKTQTLFILTMLLLVIASCVGALAVSFPMLLVARVFQAIGSGLLIPTGMNITLDVTPRDKLGKYMGIMAAMTTIGVSSSVIISGILLSFVDWPMLLWMFAALCLICLILGAVALGDVAKLTHPKLDAISIILIALALVGILYGISTAFSGSLPVAAVTFIIGCVCLALFVRRQNSLEEPLVKVSVLKVAPFRSGVLINMLALIAVFSMTIIIPTFMQSVLGATSLYASLIMFPGIVLACVISAIAGSLYDRHGIKVLLPTGFLLICAFSLLLGFFIDSNVEFLRIILFVPIACGALLIIGPVQSFSLSCLKPEDNAHGVTVMTTGFQISGCLGSSVFTGLYSAVANGTLDIGFSFEQAYSYGFLATGILTAACALIGLGFSIYIMRFKPNPYEDEQIVLANIMKPDVYTLKSNDTVLDALKFFTEKGISGAPVIDKSGEITGFLSDGDIVHYLRKQNSSFMNPYTFTVTLKDSDLAGKLDDLMKLPVGEIATKPVISVKPDDDFGKICAVIDENHLKKVPVVDDGKLVGVVNRSTVTRCAVEKYVSNNPESDKPALKETNGIQRS